MTTSAIARNATKSDLETYLPVAEAARLAGIPVRVLIEKINSGTIRAIKVNGEIAVSQTDARQGVPKEQLPEYTKHAHLRGKRIGVNEASRRYHVPSPTIGRWVKQGYIACIERVGQKMLIDEADIAYCAEVYKARGGQGRWLFNPDGTPYVPKTA